MLKPVSDLRFPWDAPPKPGDVIEVAPGLLWARLSLPFRLNHVNVWILKEEQGWTIIDTGCSTPSVIEEWRLLLSGPMREQPVERVIATHGHVDHIGLAGWFAERFGAGFVGTFAEWIWARLSHMHDVPGASAAHHSYLMGSGFDEQSAHQMVTSRRRFIDLACPVPGSIHEIRDGDRIDFGGRSWRVIVTRGHAFEHASFYDADAGILIAGDHLLPKISPVIAVYELSPSANPLGDYLASFAQFADMPADTLVLPSHGMPYYGIHQRIRELEIHHGDRLATTAASLSIPQTALSLSRTMFPHIAAPDDVGFALGETLAHVNYLISQGLVHEEVGPNGQKLYSTKT